MKCVPIEILPDIPKPETNKLVEKEEYIMTQIPLQIPDAILFPLGSHNPSKIGKITQYNFG